MTTFGRFITFIVAVAIAVVAGAVVSIAADSRTRTVNEQPRQVTPGKPVGHLPTGCWSAHEEVHLGQVFELCDFYRPTPSPRPQTPPHPRVTGWRG